MKHSYRYQYEDIELRPIEERDIETLRVWRNDSSNSKYIRKIPEITPSQQQAWFESYLQNESEFGFSIVDGNDELLGSVFLYGIEGTQAEFGRLIVGAAKGKGIGGKTTNAILHLAFEELGLTKVVATVSVDNIAALIIYTKVGFRVTGRQFNEAACMDEFSIEIDATRFSRLHPGDGIKE